MAIKFEKIRVGDVLFDVHRYAAGNVEGNRALGCWTVKIISVDPESQTAVVSWNGNRPETWDRRRLEKLYRERPPSYLRYMEEQRQRRRL